MKHYEQNSMEISVYNANFQYSITNILFFKVTSSHGGMPVRTKNQHKTCLRIICIIFLKDSNTRQKKKERRKNGKTSQHPQVDDSSDNLRGLALAQPLELLTRGTGN